MFRPGEEDRRLAEAVPVMASRASTRFLRRFTSAPAGDQQAFIYPELFIRLLIVILGRIARLQNT